MCRPLRHEKNNYATLIKTKVQYRRAVLAINAPRCPAVLEFENNYVGQVAAGYLIWMAKFIVRVR